MRRWSFADFSAALSDLTDSRYAAVRRRGREEDAREMKLDKYL